MKRQKGNPYHTGDSVQAGAALLAGTYLITNSLGWPGYIAGWVLVASFLFTTLMLQIASHKIEAEEGAAES